MNKFNLYVTSVPDHKAHLELAHIIVSVGRSMSLQTAMDILRQPPTLLLRNLDQGEAARYIEKLKELGVGFKPEPVYAPEPDMGLEDFARIKAHNEGVSKSDTGDNPAAAPKAGRNAVRAEDTSGTAGAAKPADSGAYQRQFSSGVRVGSLGALENLKEKERKARRSSITFSIAAVAVFFLLAQLLLFLSKEGDKPASSKQQQTAAAAAKTNAPNEQAPPKKQTRKSKRKQAAQAPAQEPQEQAAPDEGSAKNKMRNSVSSQQKQQAAAYVDSARASSANLNNVILFYRFAISFNRYNLAAWQGLLQAYRDLGMTTEARETEQQMLEIFGDRITSVSALVEPFGDLIDTYTSDDGTYRVEYRTQRRSRGDVLNEVFSMTRSVRSACECENISIYASTGTGRGLIAHSTPQTSIHTLSAFSSQAEIIWLD